MERISVECRNEFIVFVVQLSQNSSWVCDDLIERGFYLGLLLGKGRTGSNSHHFQEVQVDEI